jgi:hypothetical protein
VLIIATSAIAIIADFHALRIEARISHHHSPDVLLLWSEAAIRRQPEPAQGSSRHRAPIG